jgi:hypothetical protein
MKEAFARLIRWVDAWKRNGVAFTPAQLSANRSGELASEQLPPFGWQLLGLCVLGVLLFFVARWGSRLRRERGPWALAAVVGLACLAPAWALGSSLRDALLDSFEGRACAFTHITSGVRNSRWGMGTQYLDVGQRSFKVLAGSLGQEPPQVGRPYRAFFACHSETLASVEPAGDDFDLPGLNEHRAELGGLLGFDDDDLATNRSGRINAHQYPWGKLAGALVFIIGFFSAGATLLTVSDEQKWLARSFGLILIAIGLGVPYGARSFFQDAVARRSCELAGKVTELSFTFSRGAPVWHLSVAGQVLTFWRSHQGSSLIRLGQPYRVHYLCHSKELASIEPLAPPMAGAGARR